MADHSGYFTPGFFEFFRELEKNNRKEWFEANKPRYEEVVQEPAVRFVRDAAARLKKISPHLVGEAKAFGGSISRIYRDIRFSPDKSPYKTHMGIHFWHDQATTPEHMAPGYFLHLESERVASTPGSGIPTRLSSRRSATESSRSRTLGRKSCARGSNSAGNPSSDPRQDMIRTIR